jgi:arsenate reductase (glutaredoxin)
MKTKIYGIKNCDTVKKALKWLDDRKIDYDFHNYKKDGIDKAVLKHAIDQYGWEKVINRNGTTWRALPDEVKNSTDAQKAISLAEENPSIIKRPILSRMGQIVIGFDAKAYEALF